MEEENQKIIDALFEIRDILRRIDLCFEDQYLDIQKKRNAEKFERLNSILNDTKKKIYPLIFNNKNLSQSDIAKIVGVNKSTVSRFINELLQNDLIEKNKSEDKVIFIDKYGFLKMI